MPGNLHILSLAEKANTAEECMRLCIEKKVCTHYLWFKPKLGNPHPTTDKKCWVVEGAADVYRTNVTKSSARYFVTGTCGGGGTVSIEHGGRIIPVNNKIALKPHHTPPFATPPPM